MFSIKLVIGGASLFVEAPDVCIAPAGTAQYDEAMRIADDYGCPVADLIQIFPPTYHDEDCTDTDAPEFVTTVAREDRTGNPLAILIHSVTDEEVSPVAGVNYQFLYPGDRAFIMNSHGQTVGDVK